MATLARKRISILFKNYSLESRWLKSATEEAAEELQLANRTRRARVSAELDKLLRAAGGRTSCAGIQHYPRPCSPTRKPKRSTAALLPACEGRCSSSGVASSSPTVTSAERGNQPKGNGIGRDLWRAQRRTKDSRLRISPGIDVTSHVAREVIERGLDSMERDLGRK